MARIFIIHGASGHPEENWFPWLKKELEKLGYEVLVPRFPTPKGQTLKNWLKVLEKYTVDENTIVIGHSLGVPFLLNVLQKQKVRAAFFIAGFTGSVPNEFNESMKTFSQKTFDWDFIRKHCRHFFVFHSDNDPYVPLEKGKELAKNLNTSLILVKNAGHFNSAAGYTQSPLLLEKIRKIL